MDSYVLPVLGDAGVRRDLVRVLDGLDISHTLQAAQRLRSFDRPVLVAWSKEDPSSRPSTQSGWPPWCPKGKLEWIEDALTFSPEDQPDRLAGLIRSFVPARAPARNGWLSRSTSIA